MSRDKRGEVGRLYIAERQSYRQIAAEIGCSHMTVAKMIREMGIRPRRQSDAYFFDARGRRCRYHQGYILVYVPDHPRADRSGYVKRCELHYEAYTGLRLKYGQFLHHVDGNRENDDPRNLVVMTRSEHAKLHRPIEARWGKREASAAPQQQGLSANQKR